MTIIICVMHVSVVFITKNHFEYHVVHLHTYNSVTCMKTSHVDAEVKPRWCMHILCVHDYFTRMVVTNHAYYELGKGKWSELAF